jgi:hypothetical protein
LAGQRYIPTWPTQPRSTAGSTRRRTRLTKKPKKLIKQNLHGPFFFFLFHSLRYPRIPHHLEKESVSLITHPSTPPPTYRAMITCYTTLPPRHSTTIHLAATESLSTFKNQAKERTLRSDRSYARNIHTTQRNKLSLMPGCLLYTLSVYIQLISIYPHPAG